MKLLLLLLCLTTCQAQSLQEAQDLLNFDQRCSVTDWSFVLATHGYNVPQIGVVIIDGQAWEFPDGILVRA